MAKRYGKSRVPGCSCESRFTCRACLEAAGPTAPPTLVGNKIETRIGVELSTYEAFERAVRANKRSDTLTPPAEYRDDVAVLKMPGHEVYVGLIPHADRTELVGLVSNERGAGAIKWAKETLPEFLDRELPVVLDCFDGWLTEQYKALGFEVYKRVPFDPTISIPESLGDARPDVVYMYHVQFPKPTE